MESTLKKSILIMFSAAAMAGTGLWLRQTLGKDGNHGESAPRSLPANRGILACGTKVDADLKLMSQSGDLDGRTRAGDLEGSLSVEPLRDERGREALSITFTPRRGQEGILAEDGKQEPVSLLATVSDDAIAQIYVKVGRESFQAHALAYAVIAKIPLFLPSVGETVTREEHDKFGRVSVSYARPTQGEVVRTRLKYLSMSDAGTEAKLDLGRQVMTLDASGSLSRLDSVDVYRVRSASPNGSWSLLREKLSLVVRNVGAEARLDGNCHAELANLVAARGLVPVGKVSEKVLQDKLDAAQDLRVAQSVDPGKALRLLKDPKTPTHDADEEILKLATYAKVHPEFLETIVSELKANADDAAYATILIGILGSTDGAASQEALLAAMDFLRDSGHAALAERAVRAQQWAGHPATANLDYLKRLAVDGNDPLSQVSRLALGTNAGKLRADDARDETVAFLKNQLSQARTADDTVEWIEAMGNTGLPAVAVDIKKRIRDQDEAIAHSATFSLSRLPAKDVDQWLLEELKTPAPWPHQHDVLSALERRGLDESSVRGLSALYVSLPDDASSQKLKHGILFLLTSPENPYFQSLVKPRLASFQAVDVKGADIQKRIAAWASVATP